MSRETINTTLTRDNLPKLRCLACSRSDRPYSKDCKCGGLVCIDCRDYFVHYCYACHKDYLVEKTHSACSQMVDVKKLDIFIDNFFKEFDPLV